MNAIVCSENVSHFVTSSSPIASSKIHFRVRSFSIRPKSCEKTHNTHSHTHPSNKRNALNIKREKEKENSHKNFLMKKHSHPYSSTRSTYIIVFTLHIMTEGEEEKMVISPGSISFRFVNVIRFYVRHGTFFFFLLFSLVRKNHHVCWHLLRSRIHPRTKLYIDIFLLSPA